LLISHAWLFYSLYCILPRTNNQCGRYFLDLVAVYLRSVRKQIVRDKKLLSMKNLYQPVSWEASEILMIFLMILIHGKQQQIFLIFCFIFYIIVFCPLKSREIESLKVKQIFAVMIHVFSDGFSFFTVLYTKIYDVDTNLYKTLRYDRKLANTRSRWSLMNAKETSKCLLWIIKYSFVKVNFC